MAKDYGPHGGSSRSSSKSTGSHSRSRNQGGVRSHQAPAPTRSHSISGDRQADFKANPKNYITQDRGGNLPNRSGILGNTIHNISNFYRDNIYDRRPHDLKARRNFLMKNDLMKLDPVLDNDEYNDPRYSDSDWLTSSEGLAHLQGLGYKGGMLNPADDSGSTPYIYPPIETVSVEETSTPTTTSTAGLGSGHFLVPIDYVQNRRRAATGGVMDIVDRESIIKTPDEEIVTNQMEESEGQTADLDAVKDGYSDLWYGKPVHELTPEQLEDFEILFKMEFGQKTNQMEEIEGQMAGPDWFTRRVEALMYEGYSYEEASEIAYTEGPGGDYAQGGRVPAAFGGIMDTYTGRRKYGFGSFFKSAAKPFKKAAKAVKKIASSPLGKLALGYLATSGLAGLGSGTGMQGFYKPSRFMSNIAGSWNRFAPQVLKESTTKSLPFDWKDKAARLAGEEKGLLSKGLKALKNPWVSIPAASAAAGLMTAKMPEETLNQADDEYDAEKEAFDAYLASLGGSYRVPEQYRLAKGGRIGSSPRRRDSWTWVAWKKIIETTEALFLLEEKKKLMMSQQD